MHSRDRRWPAVFVVVAVLLVIFPVLYVVLYRLVGEAPQWMVSQIDWSSLNTWQNLYIVVMAIFCLDVPSHTHFGRGGASALVRRRLRATMSAMPVASIKSKLSEQVATEDVAREPFDLRWANGSVITATAEGLALAAPTQTRCAVDLERGASLRDLGAERS